jgi:hypothetical protein
MILKLWRLLRRRSRIRRLPSQLVTEYDPLAASAEENLIFLALGARDRHRIEKLMKKHGVSSPAALLPHLPKPKRPSMRRRLLRWLQRAEGTYAYDPVRAQLRRSRRRVHDVTSQTKLKRNYDEVW